MNSRDLIHGLLTKGRYDRVGLYEHFWPETVPGWVPQGYPTHTVLRDGQEVVEPVDFHDHFGFDMDRCWGPFETVPIRGQREVLEESDEWVITRNGAGAAFKRWKHHSGPPEHVDFAMSSRAIWERDYRSHLLDFDPTRIDFERARDTLTRAQAAGRWVFYGHLFAWEIARQSLGDINLYQSLVTDPDWILDFNRVYTDFFKAHFRALFEVVGLPDGIWLYEDLAFRGRLFASPRTFGKLLLPFEAELVEFFHGFGLPVVLHSCGCVTQALPLIVEAGFDALQPMEIKAGCDPLAYAQQYRDKLAFIGGLDIRILETNDRELIRQGVSDLVKGMKAHDARFIFHSDHSITTAVTYDSYRLALDVYQECMAY